MVVDVDGLIIPDSVTPDLLRGLSASAYTTSTGAIEECTRLSESGYPPVGPTTMGIAAASYAAYAKAFEHSLPSVSLMFRRFAEEYGFVNGTSTLELATKNQRMCLGIEGDMEKVAITINPVLDFEKELLLMEGLGVIKGADHYSWWLHVASNMSCWSPDETFLAVELGNYARTN